jgi:hypothetical protein
MKTALFAVAIALLSASVSAHAAPSDTLTVGNSFFDIGESGGEPGIQAILPDTPITEPGQNLTGTHTITLTEPGHPNDISDIVSATIHGSPIDGFFLDVILTSDAETPLLFTGPVDASLPETGAPQDLTSAFTGFFDLNTSLPTITVTSDVPEPSTWAMMALGFGLMGFLGYRKTRSDNALA